MVKTKSLSIKWDRDQEYREKAKKQQAEYNQHSSQIKIYVLHPQIITDFS